MINYLHKRTFNFLVLIMMAGYAYTMSATDTLLVGVHIDPPFITKNSEGSYEGLSIDLWNYIARELDKPFKYIEFSDDIGIIRALDYKELDLSINPLLSNSQRMRTLEVSQPFYISHLGVAVSTSSQSQFRIFIQNFFSMAFLNIIFILFLILLTFGTLLWLLERKHNRYQFRRGILGLVDGLWWAAVTMTTVGYGDKAPKTNAGKSIAIIWMFTAVIIISSFTATIASTLTVNTLAASIKGLSDLKIVEKIGIIGASGTEVFLARHNMNAHYVYRTQAQALRALTRKDIDVLVHDKIEIEYLINKSQLENKVQMLTVGFEYRYRSFMMPKGHPLMEAVNLHLVDRIQQPAWKETLKKYTAKGE